MSEKFTFLRNMIIKGLLLFIALNLIAPVVKIPFNQVSLYNLSFTGRERLPFGEQPQKTYNLSLYDIEVMFRSHEISGNTKNENEYRVIVLGDSSVWGTLLKPGETLAGRLNAANLTTKDGKPIRFYNLGYPSMSIMKDAILLNRALDYQPDLMVWLVTLESLSNKHSLEAPLVVNNPERVKVMADKFSLDVDDASLVEKTFWERTIIGNRRAIADWVRLQLYGVLWSATGIDQEYPADYVRAARDLEADATYLGWTGPQLPENEMAYDTLAAGIQLANEKNIPVILVNEPILISEGLNSDIRYNYYYPRWAYDSYRSQLDIIADAKGWQYYDYWDLVDQAEFTNTAVHLTPAGEQVLADEIERVVLDSIK